MIVADKIAEWLHEKRISHAYGIIGAGNIAIFDAIARLQKTRIVACHHEQAAVMAAGFHWRASGHLAAAIVTTGAGSSNALTGVLAAFMDSTPLIVISGNEPSAYLKARTRVLGVQGYDSAKMARPIVKFERRAGADPLFTPTQELETCYRAAITPRMGPTWCDIPRDIQTANV